MAPKDYVTLSISIVALLLSAGGFIVDRIKDREALQSTERNRANRTRLMRIASLTLGREWAAICHADLLKGKPWGVSNMSNARQIKAWALARMQPTLDDLNARPDALSAVQYLLDIPTDDDSPSRWYRGVGAYAVWLEQHFGGYNRDLFLLGFYSSIPRGYSVVTIGEPAKEVAQDEKDVVWATQEYMKVRARIPGAPALLLKPLREMARYKHTNDVSKGLNDLVGLRVVP
jgi:hypothetical protein